MTCRDRRLFSCHCAAMMPEAGELECPGKADGLVGVRPWGQMGLAGREERELRLVEPETGDVPDAQRVARSVVPQIEQPVGFLGVLFTMAREVEPSSGPEPT
ncbi:hypothetical protein GCM10010317_000650 [Streptomyces mirabilis]|nr:hypothetical protein GCM10010317_000650 [Streptomyces mirabilis]